MGNNTCKYVDKFGEGNRDCLMSCHSPRLGHALSMCGKVPSCVHGFRTSRQRVAGCVVNAVDKGSIPEAPRVGNSISGATCFYNIARRVLRGRHSRVLGTSTRSVRTLTRVVRTILTTSRVYMIKDRDGITRTSSMLVRMGPLVGYWGEGRRGRQGFWVQVYDSC